MNCEKRLLYYRDAARFWLKASELQRSRCLQGKTNSETARADIGFYVVAVQRIRKIARMTADRAKLSDARNALANFDAAWPRFKELRNLEEHTLGPQATQPPYGIWYFQDVVAELGPNGSVEFIVRLDDTHESVQTLQTTLEDAITRTLAANNHIGGS